MKEDEVIENWEFYSEPGQINEISLDPNRPYYNIWDDMSWTTRQHLLTQEDLDFKEYINILSDEEKIILYAHNKAIMSQDLDWLNMNYKLKNSILRHNNHFQLDKYWDVLQEHQKLPIIKKDYFDYEKYWHELNSAQKSLVLSFKDFDYDKYWSDLTPSQSLAYISYEFKIDEDKEEKIIEGLSLDENFMQFNHLFLDEAIEESTKQTEIEFGGNEYEFTEFNINDLPNHKKHIFVQILLKKKFISLNTPEYMFEKNNWTFFDKRPLVINDSTTIYKYDKKYYLPNASICITDYHLVDRFEKIKRLIDD